ncbi:MAG: hypothetical protein II266_07610, partial [Clostridia bacterium]|nr:hypothetical protein [Clostridia bacterium]
NYGAPGKNVSIKIPEWKNQDEAEVTVYVENGVISIYLTGEDTPVHVIHDENPYTHGLAGLFSTGKELAVTEISVRPIEEE